MIISQLSISPLGESVGVSKYVKIVLEVLKKENIDFETNAMSTVVETEDLDTLFDVVKKAHNAVLNEGAKRVITEIKIDDRKDKNVTAKSKLKSLS